VNAIASAYRFVREHLGKLLSGIGAGLMSLDIAGQADQIKHYADHYLGFKGAQKVGTALFVLLFIRTAYTGWKANQLKARL
jgi:hypothetical protein